MVGDFLHGPLFSPVELDLLGEKFRNVHDLGAEAGNPFFPFLALSFHQNLVALLQRGAAGRAADHDRVHRRIRKGLQIDFQKVQAVFQVSGHEDGNSATGLSFGKKNLDPMAAQHPDQGAADGGVHKVDETSGKKPHPHFGRPFGGRDDLGEFFAEGGFTQVRNQSSFAEGREKKRKMAKLSIRFRGSEHLQVREGLERFPEKGTIFQEIFEGDLFVFL